MKKTVTTLLALSFILQFGITAFADNEITIKKDGKSNIISSNAVINNSDLLMNREEVPLKSINLRRNLPSNYSSVENGYVTPMKNQKTHNTCWTFSAMSNMESALLKKGYGIYDLSEEHLDVWATSNNNKGWLRKLNDGSIPETSIGYLASWQGAKLETDIPFGYATGKNRNKIVNLGSVEYGATDIVILPNDINTIKTAIVDYGSVSASFAANHIFENDSNTAYYAYMNFGNTSSIEGHSISIVGWDDSYSYKNFSSSHQPKNNGAWLCKNSWGNYNTLSGYFWISYEDKYLFSDILGQPYAVTDVRKLDKNTKLYQVEEYGATYDMKLNITSNNIETEAKNIVYINKFDFNEQYSNLEGVMFETKSVGAKYNIYFIPIKSNKPTQDKEEWIKLSEGEVNYSGYITVDTNYILPYGSGAIGVEIDGTENNVASTLGCDEWLINTSGKYLFIPEVKENSSYMLFNNNMYELSDFYRNFFDDEIGSNFVIKAITTSDRGVKKFDVNADGEISLADAIITQRNLLGSIKFNRNQIYSADINDDYKITLLDVILMQKKILE